MRKHAGPLLLALLLILVDQVSKGLILQHLSHRMGESVPLWHGVLHFRLVQNEGVAFGFFQDQHILPFLLPVVALVAMPLLRYFLLPEGRMIDYGAVGVMAGGFSNLIDRIFRGYVVDFLEIRLFPFAIFNLADIFVTVGIVLLIIAVLFSAKGRREAVS